MVFATLRQWKHGGMSISPVARRYWRNRLAELMREIDVSDHKLAAIIEPRPEQRDNVRGQIIKWRQGRQITWANGERLAAGLTEASSQVDGNRVFTAEDVLVTEPEPEPGREDLEQELRMVERELEALPGLRDALARLPEVLDRLEALVHALEAAPPHGAAPQRET